MKHFQRTARLCISTAVGLRAEHVMTTNVDFPEILKRGRPLQLGFIPDGDCAPLVVARESGLFDKYELDVELQRRTRWANIRDGIIEGDLDAAHAPVSLPFITNLGIDSDQC